MMKQMNRTNNKWILAVVMCGFSLMAMSQGKVTFEKNVHDFGTIKEEQGKADYSFTFKNTGTAPVVIKEVKASCGCTTPYWTKEPVAPGGEGIVTASYSTMNRPGVFSKTLTVTTDAGSQVLTIKGDVTPKVRTVADDYPYKIGALRTKFRSFNLGKVTTEKPVTMDFEMYNESDEVLSFLPAEFVVPAHIQIVVAPGDIQPKSFGQLKITYDPNLKKLLGYQSDKITLKTTEATEAVKDLYVVATLEEYFPPMTEEELAKAPKLVLSKKEHDFGNIKDGDKVETVFELTNGGKTLLNIREARGNCGCTVGRLAKNDLAPGETIQMTVSFDSKGRKGKQFKNVTIFSNDPTSPTQVVTIKADVL
jgi:hypothetical protein